MVFGNRLLFGLDVDKYGVGWRGILELSKWLVRIYLFELVWLLYVDWSNKRNNGWGLFSFFLSFQLLK